MTTPHTGTESHATSTINANRCAMWDNGATKEKRPGRCVNTVIPGLTPTSDATREGLGVKPTRTCCPSAPPRRSLSGRVPDIGNVIDARTLADAVPLERVYYDAVREAVADVAEIVCRGHLYPLATNEPVHIERALVNAFAEHGLRIFTRPEPPTRRPLTQAEREAVYARDGRLCRWCRSTAGLEIDHIHPVRWGGTNDPTNLQVLCGDCNGWKSDRVAVTG